MTDLSPFEITEGMSIMPETDDMILVPRQFVQAVAALAVEDTGPGLMADAMRLKDAASVAARERALEEAANAMALFADEQAGGAALNPARRVLLEAVERIRALSPSPSQKE